VINNFIKYDVLKREQRVSAIAQGMHISGTLHWLEVK